MECCIFWNDIFHFHCFSCLKRAILNSLPDPADLPDLPDQVSETAARTYLPHAPGVRMTVVKLTPSNLVFLRFCTEFDTEMGSRRAGRGFKRFLEAVGFILAKFELKQSHGDSIRDNFYGFGTRE